MAQAYRKRKYAGEELDRKDRIRAHYFDAEDLTEEDEGYRQLLEAANKYLSHGYTRAQTVKMLRGAGEVPSMTEAHAYKVIRDALDIFGDLGESSERGLRHILSEQYLTLANIARKEGDLETWRRCLDSVARLSGLFRDIQAPKVRQQILVVGFTDDPAALKAAEIDDQETVEI